MSDVQTKISIAPTVIGGAGARSELASLWTEFRNGKMSVEEFNQAMRNTSGAIYAQRRAVMLMRTEYRNQRTALYEAMRGFRAIARIGRTITSTYLTYTMMQTRVADRTRDVRDTQEDLIKVQERRIQVVGDLGASNAIALRLINEEERLTKRLTEERRGLKQAQDQNIIGYVGIALQTLQVIPTMVALNRHIDLTKLYMGESWTYTGLKNLITTAGSAELAILGIKTTYTSLATLIGAGLVLAVTIAGLAEAKKQLEELNLLTQLEVQIGDVPPPSGVAGRQGLDLGALVDVVADVIDDTLDWLDESGTLTDVEEQIGETPPPSAVAGRRGLDLGGIIGDIIEDAVTVKTEGEDVEVVVDVVVTKTGWGPEAAREERIR